MWAIDQDWGEAAKAMGCAEQTVDGRQGASCGRSDLCAKQDANYGGLVPDGAECLPSSCRSVFSGVDGLDVTTQLQAVD